MTQTHAKKLTNTFGVGGHLSFETEGEAFPRARLNTDHGVATVHLRGAQVTDYAPAARGPALFLPENATFEEGKPVRGGVPICFPWFDKKADDPQAPRHGTAQYATWEVTAADADHEKATLTLTARLEPFDLTYTVRLGTTLELTLAVTNESGDRRCFEAALAGHYRVGDVHQTEVLGLENTAYLDRLAEKARGTQADEPLVLTGETSRLYLDPPESQTVVDSDHNRQLVMHRRGARDVVVWHPWLRRASQLEGIGEREWKQFVCLEAAAVGDHAIWLEPGQTHELAVTVSVENRMER